MILQNARFFDGSSRWPAASIRTQGAKIVAVSAMPLTPAADEPVFDLTGKFVIPGLINCHCHICLDGSGDPGGAWASRTITKNVLVAEQHAARTLRAGVTTVRDMGGCEHVDIALRNAINEGLIIGPRMKVSGKVICMTGGHGWGPGGREADGPAEVRKAAREQMKAGADVIKIMATGGVMTRGVEPGSQQLTYEEMRAAVEEAEKAGRLTASHAQGTCGIKDVVRAGIDSVEHGFYLDNEAIDMMLERGTFLVPTLAALHTLILAGEAFGVPAFMVEKAKRSSDAQLESFARAKKAGVRIAAGNDGGTPQNTSDNLAGELERLVASGCTPEEALLAGTGSAAVLMRMSDQIGSIEAGKLADMVVLGANPSVDISNVRKVEWVIKEGQRV
jgi:imidazolonepropionase-like amidohydrolase